MKADQIEEVVEKLLELKKTKTAAEIEQLPEFDEFKNFQRMLFNVVISEEMDLSIFKQMMQMKRLVEKGEERYSVDVRFGQFMAEKFIDPVLSKLPSPKE